MVTLHFMQAALEPVPSPSRHPVWLQHCMFRASKPYHLFPGKVADGAVAPEEPTAADLEEFVPQAEPRVLDEDSDLYSSDDAGPPAKKVTTRRR